MLIAMAFAGRSLLGAGTQTPPLHAVPAAQRRAHAPQLLSSFWRSAQVAPQRVPVVQFAITKLTVAAPEPEQPSTTRVLRPTSLAPVAGIVALRLEPVPHTPPMSSLQTGPAVRSALNCASSTSYAAVLAPVIVLHVFALNALAALFGQVSHQNEFSAEAEQQEVVTVPVPEVVLIAWRTMPSGAMRDALPLPAGKC